MQRPLATTLALTLLLVVPPAAMAASADAPSGATAGAQPATPTGSPTVSDASPSTVLQGLYRTAQVDADAHGLPQTADDDPLVTALKHLAEAQGRPLDDAELERARDGAEDLPPDLRGALALVVEAQADAAERHRAAGQAGTLDETDAAGSALTVAQAVDAALPVLQKYSLYYASEAQALRVDQARTVDAVVALATGTEPLEGPSPETDLPGAVLDLYDQLGVRATPTELDTMEAGAEALPDDVREAATVTTAAQARSTKLRTEAFADAGARDLALLARPGAATHLGKTPTSDHLEGSQAWLEATGSVDRAKLAQAELTLVSGALQANAVLNGQGGETADDGGVLDSIWDGVQGLFGDLNPVGVASAQASSETCPTGSPVSDCSNDVWFLDPLGIVVVSGPGTTVYDARYGQASLENRTSYTLRRLPTDGVEVQSRNVARAVDVTVEGSAPREFAENTTDRPVIRGIDEAALRRPFYAATLDLGGDDLYTHHTGSTPALNPILMGSDGANASADALTLGLAGEVDALDEAPGAEAPLPDPDTVAANLPLFNSVLVETGGNDRYDPGLANRSDRTIASASTGGLAVLLDASGDDTYDGGNHSVAAADTLGRAVLLDLDGEDTYEAEAASAGAGQVLGHGLLLDDCAAPPGETCPAGDDVVDTGPRSQGFGAVAGIGALVNLGGDDTYHLEGTTGQGEAALLGLGALVDVAGRSDEGLREGQDGDTLSGVEGDKPWTAEVVARPNDRPVEAVAWTQDPRTGGAGLALEVDHPAALELTPEREGVIASFERTSVPGLDLPGLLFLDGATDTLYEQDYVLTVDLAGFDRYRNNAGGAIDLSDASQAEDTAGTSLALDLSGDDRYDTRNASTSAWGVQGAARNGAGLLVDLGKGQDTYAADRRAQAAAGEDAAALLLDDGATDGRDRFLSGNASQGSGQGGFAALVTLDGDTRYEAGDRSQGYGSQAGAGLLVDRRLDRRTGKVETAGLPPVNPDGDDVYQAGELAQGAAASGGLGLVLDTGGNDTYRSVDRAQGYSTPGVPDAGGAHGAFTDTASRGLLVDLTGRDRYTASADEARAHGFGAGSPDGDSARALLADFALPRVPLLAPDDVTIPTIGGGNTGEGAFPEYDPTSFYDDWLREGRGDRYVPRQTPDGDHKRENSYWQQPDGQAAAGLAPSEDARVAGLGMDNPPIAATKAGADRFFEALRTVDDATEVDDEAGVDLRGAFLNETEPEATLHVHPVEDGHCTSGEINRSAPATDVACLEVHVEQTSGVTADPDRNMEVTFELKKDETDAHWVHLGTARSSSLYDAAKERVASEVGFSSLSLGGTFTIDTNPDPASAPTPGFTREAVARFVLDADALCTETDGNGYCPDDPDDHLVDAMAFPDGDYTARAEVRTATATVTAGRAATQDTAEMAVENRPRLLGVDVQHPNPATRSPGVFSLLTSDPHRGSQVQVETPIGTKVAQVEDHASEGGIGTPDADASPLDRTIYRTDARWLDDADRFPETGRYAFEASVNRYDRPFNVTHRIHLASGERADLPTTLPTTPTNASVAGAVDEAVIAGGVDADGLRDAIVGYEADEDDPLQTDLGTLPTPLADAAVASTTDAGTLILYLFGGRTPSGLSDAVIRVEVSDPVDPDGATVDVVDTLPEPLTGAAAVKDPGSNRIYVLGGRDADGLRDDIFAYDVDDGGVTPLEESLPSPRTDLGAAWNDDGITIAGGRDAGGHLDALHKYNPAAKLGSRIDAKSADSLPKRLSDVEARTYDGAVYLFGGVGPDGRSHDLYRVDFSEDETVASVGTVPERRQDTLVSVDAANGHAYVFAAGAYEATRGLEGNVTVDATPPTTTLPVEGDAVGGGLADDGQVHVPVEAHDGESGVDRIEVLLSTDGETDEVVVEPSTPTPPELAAQAASSASHGDTLEVRATAVDGAGNRAETVTATYEVDLRKPTATTTIPHPPSRDGDVVLQNATRFPVGWTNASDDAERMHLSYRVHGVHTDFQDGLVAPADAGSTTFPGDRLAGDHLEDGARIDIRVQAEDDAGNLQSPSDAEVRTVGLDLVPPGIVGLSVDPGFDEATVTYNLTEPGVAHRAHVTGPDGGEETLHQVRTTDEVTFVLQDLETGTPYDLTVRSVDRVGNPSTQTVNFTTEATLTLDWQTPEPGAVISGEAPLRFLVGATAEARETRTTFTLTAEPQDGDLDTLASAVPVEVQGTRSDPQRPGGIPYPHPVDSTLGPDGETVVLQLRVENEQGATTATRTVTVDNTPPERVANASATLEGPLGPVDGAVPWFNGPVNVTSVPATDAVTGVDEVRYAWGPGPLDQVLEGQDPPIREDEGVHVFRWQAVDAAGNVQPDVHERRFGVDTTPPTVDASTRERAVDEANVTVDVEADDATSGAVEVRVHVGDEADGWTSLSDGAAEAGVTLPSEDGVHPVTVAVRDRAGNVGYRNLSVTYSTRPPAFLDTPSVEPISPVAVEVTWRTDKVSHTNLTLPNASADLRTTTPGLTGEHRVVVEGLEPDATYDALVGLEDPAGHAAEPHPFTLSTPADPSPPSAPANVTAVDTDDGSVVLAWSPARDESGIDRYVVKRAGPGSQVLEPVANVSTTQYVDPDPTLGETYRYEIEAVDAAGKAGPAANATATPTRPPAISNASLEAGGADGTAVLVLEVVVDPGGRPVESVTGLVDGTEVAMDPVSEADDGATVYQATVNGSALTPEDGVDVAFTASDGEATVRHPEDGALKVEASEFPGDAASAPGLGPVGLVAALAATAAAARARLSRGRDR